ncbi:trypsin-like serine peptidase [Kitasatospora sp. NPDC088391]|uniref:trypsin-like serine peptidase n=1 Tax=Kitasatospora sp. NPDC088391 TaxID=3364074 RepID=UPI0037FCFCCF
MPRSTPGPGPRPLRTAGATALLLAAATGCGSTAPAPTDRPTVTSSPAAPDRAADRVGQLFLDGLDGARFCTASVVHGGSGSLLITAAHCVAPRGVPVSGLVFAPGYRDGRAPYGSWPVTGVKVDPHWGTGEDDERYDVAFLTVDRLDGRRIEDVLGAERFSTDGGDAEVTVTGYPNAGTAPVTCRTRAVTAGENGRRFDCAGFPDGTSGSPWVTGDGRVVGVIGGYQEGGDTADTSYSPVFDERTAELYRQADGG